MTKKQPLPGFEPYLPQKPPPLVRDFSDLTAREVAHIFSVTVQAVDAWRRTGCPVTKIDGRLQFDLPAVISWRRERDMANTAAIGGDPLLAGSVSGSPALERYRTEKAKLAALDYKHRRGQLIDKNTLNRKWRAVGARLRAALESIERKFGREVGDAIREAIESVSRDLNIT